MYSYAILKIPRANGTFKYIITCIYHVIHGVNKYFHGLIDKVCPLGRPFTGRVRWSIYLSVVVLYVLCVLYIYVNHGNRALYQNRQCFHTRVVIISYPRLTIAMIIIFTFGNKLVTIIHLYLRSGFIIRFYTNVKAKIIII